MPNEQNQDQDQAQTEKRPEQTLEQEIATLGEHMPKVADLLKKASKFFR